MGELLWNHWLRRYIYLEYTQAAVITTMPCKQPHWEYNDAYYERERFGWLLETVLP